jgi:hypothetical protein
VGPRKVGSRRELDLRYTFRFKTLDVLSTSLQAAIKWGALVCIAYLASKSIGILAGKVTLADIGIGFLANVKLSQGISYIACIGGVAYGLRERKLRRDAIQHLSGRKRDLERMIDHQRSSSGLTPRGTTRPED